MFWSWVWGFSDVLEMVLVLGGVRLGRAFRVRVRIGVSGIRLGCYFLGVGFFRVV